jgi:predicted GNAT family acetyltransferase
MAEHEHRNAKNTAVVHNASNQRFEINIDGQLSVLEYTFKNHRLFLTHTEVPPALESRGPGTELVACRSEFVTAKAAGGVRVFPLDGTSIGGVSVDVATEFAS